MTRTPGTSRRSPRCSVCRTGWPTRRRCGRTTSSTCSAAFRSRSLERGPAVARPTRAVDGRRRAARGRSMKRVFISEYVGLSTRLEALAMAFLISERHGHQVCLDWHELDALAVEGTRRRGRGLLGRLDSIKLRSYDPATFARVGEHRNVVLRTHEGPRELLEPLYLPVARRVKLRADLVDVIRATFAACAERPLVGVHIRRGDFALLDPDEFDVNATEWPAVPDWWYAHVMADLRRAFPEVAFFVACTGSLDDYPALAGFDAFDLPTTFPYGYKGPSHGAKRHPAADLFALAC